MKKLTVKVVLPPERLAKICREHGDTCGDLRFGVRVCPFAGASCPIDNSDKTCGNATAEDWEKVLQDEELEPEFRFGDKVLADRRKAVFVHYQYGTTKKAEVLYEEDDVTSTVTSDAIEAGWHDQEECR